MRINIRCPCREFWNYIGVRLILTGREPVMRISTSLLALCCQLGLDATLDTPIRARSRSSGSRSLLISPLSMARSTSATSEGARGYALDPKNAKALWKKSEELVGESF
jgi:hypothetical protein